jgi:beta-phosphoglucomutase-like phosphatase (HAD superfamily)
MALEALIFDVDGTLVETEKLHRPAFNQGAPAHYWRGQSESCII